MIPLPPSINYIFDGLIGGILYILISKFGYDQRWDITRRLIIGAIAGYAIYRTGFPNHLVAIGIGYTGQHAIEAILIKNKIIRTPYQIEPKKRN